MKSTGSVEEFVRRADLRGTCWRVRMFSGLLVGIVALGISGCQWIGPGRPTPTSGDVFWSEAPVSNQGARVAERWTLTWDSDDLPQVVETMWKGLRSSTLTLAVVGELPRGLAHKDSAERIVQAFERSALDLQNQGVVVRGLHLDFRAPESSVRRSTPTEEGQNLGELFKSVRGRLGREVELSAALPALTQEDLEAQIATMGSDLDWVLIDLYGQDYDAIDEPRLWDLEAAVDRLRVVRAAGVPSRGLIRLEGSVDLLIGAEARPLTNHLSCELLIELAAKSESVFKFEGYFRQVFEARSRRDVLRLGGTEIDTGARLRVSRVTPEHLRRLGMATKQLEDEQFLGFVYRGVTKDSENCLGVDRRALERASEPVEKLPQVILDDIGENLFRLTLEGGSEPTALGRKRYNFVDLVASDGGLIDDAEIGDFSRYVFLSPDGKPLAGFAGKGVRFYLPLLSPGQIVSATVRTRRVGRLTATAVFRSSTGEALTTESVVWPAS